MQCLPKSLDRLSFRAAALEKTITTAIQLKYAQYFWQWIIWTAVYLNVHLVLYSNLRIQKTEVEKKAKSPIVQSEESWNEFFCEF